MDITKVKIADLKPHPQNYNLHPEAQLVELEKSLESFDQFKNIVVCQNTILAGHGLVQAAKRKGLKELDACVRAKERETGRIRAIRHREKRYIQ